jgi:hypothetical protein
MSLICGIFYNMVYDALGSILIPLNMIRQNSQFITGDRVMKALFSLNVGIFLLT